LLDLFLLGGQSFLDLSQDESGVGIPYPKLVEPEMQIEDRARVIGEFLSVD